MACVYKEHEVKKNGTGAMTTAKNEVFICSEGPGVKLWEAFILLLSKHAQAACLWCIFRVDKPIDPLLFLF